MSPLAWTSGNELELLENGEAFFPRVFEAIAAARIEVLVETFIVAEDEVGTRLRDTLAAAAGRGVRVQLVIDGYGSADLSADFLGTLTGAGVTVRWFDPQPRRLGIRVNPFRRLHRKLVLVDGDIAFIGGINFSVEHLRKAGASSKQDYAVRVRGAVAGQVREVMGAGPPPPWNLRRWLWRRAVPAAPPQDQTARAVLVTRDNRAHRQDIERVYRLGIRAARHEIIVANAYFFPGYRLLRDLRAAARRGVAVHLLLQGRSDMRLVQWATGTLYHYLLRGGVHIHEYCERPMHGKVAVIDSVWATVGSSNLDPLSLFLNLEANLVAQDRRFAAKLRHSLARLMREQCKELTAPPAGPSTPLRLALGFASYHAARRLPRLAGWLPAHAPERSLLRDAAGGGNAGP
jgi:cardiolipin synthase